MQSFNFDIIEMISTDPVHYSFSHEATNLSKKLSEVINDEENVITAQIHCILTNNVDEKKEHTAAIDNGDIFGALSTPIHTG